MKIDITKFEKVKEGSSKIQISEGRLAIWSKGDRVKFSFTVENDGIYHIIVKARTGKEWKEPYSKGYNFFVDGDNVDYIEGEIGPLLPKVYGEAGSNWGTFIIETRLTKGTHTLEVEAILQWLGIESIDVEPFKLDEIDYKTLLTEAQKKLTEEKIRADTAELNLNAVRTELNAAKATAEKATELKKILMPNKEALLKDLQNAIKLLEEI